MNTLLLRTIFKGIYHVYESILLKKIAHDAFWSTFPKICFMKIVTIFFYINNNNNKVFIADNCPYIDSNEPPIKELFNILLSPSM